MGPAGEPHLTPLPGGVDGVVDRVKRRQAFAERHPEVMITSPR